MSIFLKKKINSEKFHPATLNEVTKTLRAIFSQAFHYDTEHKREKLLNINLSDEFSNDQLDEIKEAHIFVTDYFKTKNMIYHIVQIDRGKNLELAADSKTAILSPLADTAKLIPVPIVGHVVAGGAKKALKFNSDKKRIERAKKKSGYMPPHQGMIALITLLFVKVHLAKIKYETITAFYENLNEELDIFFSTAKKQMENNPDSKYLKDFWADVFSTYLQETISNNASSDEYFLRNVSLRKILNKDLKPLFSTIENNCPTLYPENKKKISSDPLCSLANSPQQNVAVAPDDPRPPTLDPQPGPPITFTLSPTLSPQYLPSNNNSPNSLVMNIVIPENQGSTPITLCIPSTNQPLLINILPATRPAVYAPHASASITYPVLSNPSPQATIPALNPYNTNITEADCEEEKPLTVSPVETFNSVNKNLTSIPITKSLSKTTLPPQVATPTHIATASMDKTKIPQSFSIGQINPPVNLNQLQACVEIMAYIGSLLLTKPAQELYTKRELSDKKLENTGLSQTVPQMPKNVFKPNDPAFFSCGTFATKETNMRPFPYLRPAA